MARLKKFGDRENRERGQRLAVETKFMYDFANKLQQNIAKKQGKRNPRLDEFIKNRVFAKENMQPAFEVLKKRALPVEPTGPTPLTDEQRYVMVKKLAESMHKHESLEKGAQSGHEHIGKVFKKVARALQGPGDHQGEEDMAQNQQTAPEKHFTEWKTHAAGKDDMKVARKEKKEGPPGKGEPLPNRESYESEMWYMHHWDKNPAKDTTGHLSREQVKKAKKRASKAMKLQSKSGSKVDHVLGARLWENTLMSFLEPRTNHHVINVTNAPNRNDTRASSKPLSMAGSERPTLLARALENDCDKVKEKQWRDQVLSVLCHDKNDRIHHLGKEAPSFCRKTGHWDKLVNEDGPRAAKLRKRSLLKRGAIPPACLVPWDGPHPGHKLPAGCDELIRMHQGHDAAKGKAEEGEQQQRNPKLGGGNVLVLDVGRPGGHSSGNHHVHNFLYGNVDPWIPSRHKPGTNSSKRTTPNLLLPPPKMANFTTGQELQERNATARPNDHDIEVEVEVDDMGPARVLKRWVRHSLTWSNIERPTIHKVPAATAAAAPSPAAAASTTPDDRA